MQLDFLTTLFKKAKDQGIHTCLDTSAATYSEARREDFETLLSYTDLVLLDFKHSDREEHKKLTGMYNDAPLAFAKLLSEKKIPMVVRHVLVPEITDTEEQLQNLGKLMKQFKNVVGLEVLPFHQMGTVKYKNLGIPYPLEGVPALTKEDGKRAKETILKAYRGA
jgi:pyruvate formate lyase activating enzyme